MKAGREGRAIGGGEGRPDIDRASSRLFTHFLSLLLCVFVYPSLHLPVSPFLRLSVFSSFRFPVSPLQFFSTLLTAIVLCLSNLNCCKVLTLTISLQFRPVSCYAPCSARCTLRRAFELAEVLCSSRLRKKGGRNGKAQDEIMRRRHKGRPHVKEFSPAAGLR